MPQDLLASWLRGDPGKHHWRCSVRVPCRRAAAALVGPDELVAQGGAHAAPARQGAPLALRRDGAACLPRRRHHRLEHHCGSAVRSSCLTTCTCSSCRRADHARARARVSLAHRPPCAPCGGGVLTGAWLLSLRAVNAAVVSRYEALAFVTLVASLCAMRRLHLAVLTLRANHKLSLVLPHVGRLRILCSRAHKRCRVMCLERAESERVAVSSSSCTVSKKVVPIKQAIKETDTKHSPCRRAQAIC